MLGPALINLYLLNGPERWQLFFESKENLLTFCDTCNFSELRRHFDLVDNKWSVSDGAGGADTYHISIPRHTGLESFSFQDQTTVLELFRLATGEIGEAFLHDRPPVGGISAWAYQWVWEFYYQTGVGSQIGRTGVSQLHPTHREAFRSFIQQKITVFKRRTESSAPFNSKLYFAVNEAKRMGAGFFDARTLAQRLEEAESREPASMVTFLKYLIPESSISARLEPEAGGGLLGPIRKFPGYGRHLYDTGTVATALTSHCHTTPGPELFSKRFISPRHDRIRLSHCFQQERSGTSYSYEDFIPRAIGRDAIQPHYDVIISNPIARKWFTARRRMDKITLTHEVQTTTP